jgi:regulator of RNase E activity RraA
MFIDADTSNIRVSSNWPRPSMEEVHTLGRFPAALIGDAQSRIGVMRSDIRLRTPGLRLAGTVLPVLTREGDNLAIHRALDEAQEGDVLVINANSDTNRACFGGLLGEACVSRGITGVVIDGATRDVDELLQMKLPVFATGTSPAGPFKNGPGLVGSAVACGNVVCQPGDAIIGDSDGIVVVARDRIADLITLVQAQEAIEDRMRERIRSLA